MPPIEAQAARRRAELLWQQQMRTDADAADTRLQQSEQHALDEKTARLRSMRLAKEAVERETVPAKPERIATAKRRM